MNIPREKVEEILRLPRKTLVEDLRKIVRDTINRREHFESIEWSEDSHEFLLHALWLLSDLKAEEALPDVLDLMRQDKDFLEYWFSDSLTEHLWEVLFHIGGQSPDQLKSFALEPETYSFARSVPAATMVQIALHRPER